jgi:CRISPR-associated protein Csm3
VRDAFLTQTSRDSLQKILGPGSFTELKTENAIDRVTSEPNPRPVERIPAGSEFNFNIIIDSYAEDGSDLNNLLLTAMSLLEQSSLGGSGSRGSGQIAFRDINLLWRSSEDFAKGNPGKEIPLPGSTIDNILQNFNKINWPTS